jgi:hypothetical protein
MVRAGADSVWWQPGSGGGGRSGRAAGLGGGGDADGRRRGSGQRVVRRVRAVSGEKWRVAAWRCFKL